MTALAWLIPCALALGAVGLVAFIWALNSGQFQDLEGSGWRAISDDEDDIVADYLRSNDAVAPLLAHVRRTCAGAAEADGLPTDAMLGVRASYLEHGLDVMKSTHGSFEGYLNYLGIDRDLRQRLTAALVEV